jgi:hypothetical protein
VSDIFTEETPVDVKPADLIRYRRKYMTMAVYKPKDNKREFLKTPSGEKIVVKKDESLVIEESGNITVVEDRFITRDWEVDI